MNEERINKLRAELKDAKMVILKQTQRMDRLRRELTVLGAYKTDNLVNKITKNNVHPETQTGSLNINPTNKE